MRVASVRPESAASRMPLRSRAVRFRGPIPRPWRCSHPPFLLDGMALTRYEGRLVLPVPRSRRSRSSRRTTVSGGGGERAEAAKAPGAPPTATFLDAAPRRLLHGGRVWTRRILAGVLAAYVLVGVLSWGILLRAHDRRVDNRASYTRRSARSRCRVSRPWSSSTGCRRREPTVGSGSGNSRACRSSGTTCRAPSQAPTLTRAIAPTPASRTRRSSDSTTTEHGSDDGHESLPATRRAAQEGVVPVRRRRAARRRDRGQVWNCHINGAGAPANPPRAFASETSSYAAS